MVDFERIARWGIVITVALVGAYKIGILSALGFGWEALLAPLAIILASIGALAINSILEPTVGKIMRLAGIGLMIAPFLTDRIPAVAILGGIVLLAITRYQRIREVYLS